MTPFARSSCWIAPIRAYWPRRCCVVALSSLEIAEGRHELRQWNRLGGAPLERDGLPQPALRRLDLCECVERIDIARSNRERDPIVLLRETQTAVRPEELAELRLRPRERLRLTDGGFDCEAHGVRRTPNVAHQLPRIRHTRVGRQARLHGDHLVERRERLVIATELDERVADHAVAASRGRRDRDRAATERQRLPKAMS